MGRLTHTQIEELLGAYALDAVDRDESEAVERHLHECPRCRAEVAEHREVAAMLAHAGAEAPGGVWDGIAGRLDERDAADGDGPVAPIVPLRFGRQGVPGRVVAAVLSAAAVLVTVLGVQVVRQEARIDELAASVQRRGVAAAATAALLEPEARKVTLTSDDGGVSVDAVVLPNGEGFLVRHNLPPLEDGLTYQLWAMAGSTTVSVGVLGPDPETVAFRAPATVKVLALTTEKGPEGVVATQNRPLATGFLAEA